MALVDTLFDGPLDLVGDVHGEIDALLTLLDHLGYDRAGRHPASRRLVFLGDLIDRGPDSPAVLEVVRQMVAAGRAQCVLGNHELNLLRDIRKHGNDWYTKPGVPGEFPARAVRSGDREAFRQFCASLPAVLERPDLRVVHACWNAAALAAVRSSGAADALTLYEHYRRQAEAPLADGPLRRAMVDEYQRHGDDLRNPDWDPVFLPAIAEADRAYQMGNPLRILTSGEEAATGEPFWAGGRWRMVSRVLWWQHYREPVPVVIGHYWRRYSEAAALVGEKYGPDVFAGTAPHHWMGPTANVYCVDFSVGARPSERHRGKLDFVGKLAALRVPEWQVVHDDGECWDIGPPGAARETP